MKGFQSALKMTEVDPPKKIEGKGTEKKTVVEGKYTDKEKSRGGFEFRVRTMAGLTGDKTYVIPESEQLRGTLQRPSPVERRAQEELDKGSFSPERLLTHERAKAIEEFLLKYKSGAYKSVLFEQGMDSKKLVEYFKDADVFIF